MRPTRRHSMEAKGCLAALLLFLCSVSLETSGADVFRWVDENGKVHYGESVPEKYKQNARRVSPSGAEVSDERRKEAEARAAKDRARVEALQRRREDVSDSVQSGTAPSPSPANPQTADSCREQMRKYLESHDCFAPYRLVDGGVRPEAFQHCKEVPEPRGCRPPHLSSEPTYVGPALPR